MPTRGRSTRRPPALAALMAAGLILSGCASAPPDSVTQTQDPWEKFNRGVYAFNDKLDKAVARPVAGAYNRAMPAPARSGFHNMLSNLGEPVTMVNDTLQGKLMQALKDTGRFIINSTVGLLGFFDVAQHVGLPDHKEDLGQTLAVWGVPSGPYLVIPVLGPSTVRDAASLYPDYYTNPLKNNMPPRYKNATTIAGMIDTRAGLMDANSSIDSAYDPYAFVRDAYIQHRRYEIYDGNLPASDQDYELPPDEGTAAPPSSAAPPATAAPPSSVPTSASITPAAKAATQPVPGAATVPPP